MEYVHILNSGIAEHALDDADFIVAALANIVCIIVVITMSYWWWRLRISTTNLRPLILAIAFAKAALWMLTAIWMLEACDYIVPHIFKTSARTLFFIAASLQVWVTTRIKPAPKTESLPGPFHSETDYKDL